MFSLLGEYRPISSGAGPSGSCTANVCDVNVGGPSAIPSVQGYYAFGYASAHGIKLKL